MTHEQKIQAAKIKSPRHYDIRLDETHHVVLCDGKPLLTPAGHAYALPTERLAQAVAAEWREQAENEKIDVAALPLSQLVATALDIVARQKSQIVASLLTYSATELLCHRAELPQALGERQEKVWQPILDWCALRFGALMQVGTGIMPIPQTVESVTAFEKALESYDLFRLTGLRQAIDVSSSLVLGLALIEKFRTAQEVFRAAELDALFQIEIWGEDPVTTARMEAVERDLKLVSQWFDLLG